MRRALLILNGVLQLWTWFHKSKHCLSEFSPKVILFFIYQEIQKDISVKNCSLRIFLTTNEMLSVLNCKRSIKLRNQSKSCFIYIFSFGHANKRGHICHVTLYLQTLKYQLQLMGHCQLCLKQC